jgi:gluconokinase
VANSAPPVWLIMGVCGCGKSTLGAALARALGWTFQEGDELHPPANLAKMASGAPLDDDDRAPWLAAVGDWIDTRGRAGEAGVITCSALKRAYRRRLAEGRPPLRLIYLHGEREDIRRRLAARAGHFMPASLLDSQFADLDPPTPEERALWIPIDMDGGQQLQRVLAGARRDVESMPRR